MNQYLQQLYTKEANVAHKGTLFFLDGASCSGKTSMRNSLLQDQNLNLEYIPRYCTRYPREGEISGEEYIFIAQKKFDDLEKSDDLIEYRHFEFGMSYGIPWKESIETIRKGKNGLGIINLGNIVRVRNVVPDAITILIEAPEETIKRRLIQRGTNTEEQIAERLSNARSVDSFRQYYHYIVNNDDGMYEKAEHLLKEIVKSNIQ